LQTPPSRPRFCAQSHGFNSLHGLSVTHASSSRNLLHSVQRYKHASPCRGVHSGAPVTGCLLDSATACGTNSRCHEIEGLRKMSVGFSHGSLGTFLSSYRMHTHQMRCHHAETKQKDLLHGKERLSAATDVSSAEHDAFATIPTNHVRIAG
jgi:hypothetical protein